jgi:hypothetical protein
MATSKTVGDIVHSFCYLVRNPDRIGEDITLCWPFILSEGKPEISWHQRSCIPFDEYRGFLRYAIFEGKNMTAVQYSITVSALMHFTRSWTTEDFKAATVLLSKYYGVQ